MSILFENKADASVKAGAVADVNGNFKVALAPGTYSVKGQYTGYKTYERLLNIASNMNLGIILL